MEFKLDKRSQRIVNKCAAGAMLWSIAALAVAIKAAEAWNSYGAKTTALISGQVLQDAGLLEEAARHIDSYDK